MRKIQTEGIKAMEVKQEVVDEIYAHFDTFHANTVWQENCRSWFKDGKIKNRIYLWPGSVSLPAAILPSCTAPCGHELWLTDYERQSISSRLSKIPGLKIMSTVICTRIGLHI
jgi:hypothetical protein